MQTIIESLGEEGKLLIERARIKSEDLANGGTVGDIATVYDKLMIDLYRLRLVNVNSGSPLRYKGEIETLKELIGIEHE